MPSFFFCELQLIKFLLLICDSYLSQSTRFISLKLWYKLRPMMERSISQNVASINILDHDVKAFESRFYTYCLIWTLKTIFSQILRFHTCSEFCWSLTVTSIDTKKLSLKNSITQLLHYNSFHFLTRALFRYAKCLFTKIQK